MFDGRASSGKLSFDLPAIRCRKVSVAFDEGLVFLNGGLVLLRKI